MRKSWERSACEGKTRFKVYVGGRKDSAKAERVIEAIREAKGCINVRDENMGGTLRLGVPYSYVRYVMPALLAEYTAKYPNVKIEIITALSDELARSVEDGMIDICFARYNAEDSYLQRHLVSEDQFAQYITTRLTWRNYPIYLILNTIPIILRLILYSGGGMITIRQSLDLDSEYIQETAVFL